MLKTKDDEPTSENSRTFLLYMRVYTTTIITYFTSFTFEFRNETLFIAPLSQMIENFSTKIMCIQ